MKRKNPRFHSPEGVPCQQIGSYHYAHPISLRQSFRNHYRSMNIRITPLLLNPHQSVFCESPENALGIHPIVFLCEQGLCRALRLTFCQLERLPSGDDVLHFIHYYPLIPYVGYIEIPQLNPPQIPFLIGPGDQTGRPYIWFYWTSCRKDNCTLSIEKVTVCHLHQMMDDNKIIIEILVRR